MGTILRAGAPLPSWPCVLSPQQWVAPAVVTPQVCSLPTVRFAKMRPPETATGDGLGLVVPSPNSPFVLKPQQYALPLLVRAQECHPPEAIETKSRVGLIHCGVFFCP